MKRKAFIFSVLVHILLVYFFMTARFEIKESPVFKQQVIEVVPVAAVPVKKIYVPENAQPPPPAQDAEPASPPPPGDEKTGQAGEVPIVIQKFVLDSPPPGQPDGDRSLEPARVPAAGAELPVPEHENAASPASASDPVEPGRLIAPDLSIYSPVMKEIMRSLDEKEKNQDSPAVKKKYDFTGIPFDSVDVPFGEGGDGITAYGGGAYFKTGGYDITPWARRMVYRVKKNWLLPMAVRAGVKGVVGVFIVVEKNGKLSQNRLRQSARVEAYDRAALNAFQLSAPFPPLPGDFPRKNLEVYFVFHYN
jgi:TonB family protein